MATHQMITTRLPRRLADRLDEKARRQGVSLNVLCVGLLQALLDGKLYTVDGTGNRRHMPGVSPDIRRWSGERREDEQAHSHVRPLLLGLYEESEYEANDRLRQHGRGGFIDKYPPVVENSDCKSAGEGLQLTAQK
jgi:hypothetical protein